MMARLFNIFLLPILALPIGHSRNSELPGFREYQEDKLSLVHDDVGILNTEQRIIPVVTGEF